MLKQDRFWQEKVGALNFVEFLIQLEKLKSEALKNSLFNSSIKINDAVVTQILLDEKNEIRCAVYYLNHNHPLFDRCLIALRENLITVEQLKENIIVFYLLKHDFVIKALRDKLISVETLLAIDRPLPEKKNSAITTLTFHTIIYPILEKLIKEKLGTNFMLSQYGSDPHKDKYKIFATCRNEEQIIFACENLTRLGIDASIKEGNLTRAIKISKISAHNLRVALQKMAPIEQTKKTPSTHSLAMRSSSLFSSMRMTETQLTLRPKKPRRV